jgi:hypothetical protein
MYRPVVALVALSATLIVAGTTTVADADRSRRQPGSQTRTTATPVLPGEITPARLLLGAGSTRSHRWFAVGGKAGERYAITLTHAGEPGGRALVLGVGDTRGARRGVRVGVGTTSTLRGRIGPDGRVLVQVGCRAVDGAARCGAAGIVPFRLRASTGDALVRAVRGRGAAPLPLRAAPSPTI